ncbi:Kinesin-like protein KLP1 [Diplonema papillatum]|nr:Kinesin-like protein KLP1 [Diplonema papillatum]
MVSNHATNNASSRSHCIFTLHVKSRSRVESDSHILASKLNLVDLAGSERVAKTGSEGSTLREATYINKSLSFLEQVVIALGSQGRSHVPYRQCKLTNVLKDSIGGNCKTVMIANAWGEEQHLDETLSTLKFATRMMKVQNEASVNVELDSASHIKALQRQIAELKAELQMQNQLHGKSHVKYDAFSDEERFELEKKVEQYLAGVLSYFRTPPLLLLQPRGTTLLERAAFKR